MKKTTILTFILLIATALAATAQDGEKWRVVGDLHFGNKIWKAPLVAFDDGTYTIQDWYGHEGYDVSFRVNKNGTLHFIDYVSETVNDTDVYVQYEAYEGQEIGFYQDKHSGFFGDNIAGSLYFGGEVWQVITFVWPAAKWTESGEMSIYDADGKLSSRFDASISCLSDNSYRINGWHYYPAADLCFSVNEDGTIHITNGFTIGAMQDNITSVYATADKSIKLYTDIHSLMKGDIEHGKVVFYDIDENKYRFLWPLAYDDAEWVTSGEIHIPVSDKPIDRKITMIARDDDSYSLLNWYEDGYDLSFTVNENGTLHFIDGEPVPWDPTYYQVPYCVSPLDSRYSDNTWLYQDDKSSFHLNDDNSGNLSFVDYNLSFNNVTFEQEPITFVWGPGTTDMSNPYDTTADEPLGPAGINGIYGDSLCVTVYGSDILVPEGAVVYDINGRIVTPRGLSKGTYIVKSGNRSVKVIAGK